jgi:hypothetical protein
MKRSRRAFMAVSLTLPGAWTFQLDAQSNAQGARLTVLVDERHANSRAFAWRARIAGARVLPLRDEIGSLWLDRLGPLASARGSVLAGLTTHADAFLLERFALANGLVVRRRRVGEGALVAWRIERAG